MGSLVCRPQHYHVEVYGGRGPRGKDGEDGQPGAASGPLADGVVEARHLTNDPDKLTAIRNKIGAGTGGSASLYFVDGSSYPGTTLAADPDRINNDTVKLRQAQADVTDSTSPNYGKIVVWPGNRRGSGVRDPDEWNSWYPKAGATYADSKDPAQLVGGKKPIDPAFMTEDGDYTFYDWSQNGRVTSENPVTIVEQGQHPGNLDPRVHHLFLDGARVRKPKMAIIPPLMLVFDPNKTAATTKNGIDTQTAVKGGGSIVGLVTVGGVHYLGRNNHFNSVSLNGVGDYNVEMRGFGSRCDELYLGAGNVGDGTWNRHNVGVTFDVWADGWNTNNRNSVSIVDGTRIRGKIYAINFGQKGGSGAVDSYNPETGVSAPSGGCDVEPNDFTDDPWIDDILLDIRCENSGTAALATLLLDSDNKPKPIRNITARIVSKNNYRGMHVAIGGTNMMQGYLVTIRDSLSEGDFRPFELLAGQGVKHINNTYLRSRAAGYIGYTGGAQMQNLLFEDCLFQELGIDDARGIENRGWAGGGMRRCEFLNCKVSGIEHLNGSPIERLEWDVVFRNDAEITTKRNMAMQFGHYVNSSNGGALIVPGKMIDRSPRPTLPNVFWEVNGAWVFAIPGSGLWDEGNSVRFLDVKENGPTGARVFQANTTGAPFFEQTGKRPGLIDPVFAGAVAPGSLFNMRNQPNGKFTAIGPNARAIDPSQSSGGSIFGRAPFLGTRTVYWGYWSTATPNSPSQLKFGIAFVLTGQGYGAIAILGGQPASTRRDFAYGDSFQIVYASNGTSFVQLKGATIYSSPTDSVSGYSGVLIQATGEDALLAGN